MASYQTSAASNQPRFGKANILGVFFFLMGAPHVYVFFNPNPRDRENTLMPKFVTLVLTASALAGLIEWLVLKA
jgi:hypothetical protein